MSQLAVVMLALFGHMERTNAIERAAHARAVAVAVAKGKSIGRPSVIEEDQSMSEIVKAAGITRSSLYRYLPPPPPETLTAGI
jgi:DNA-binding phage protein